MVEFRSLRRLGVAAALLMLGVPAALADSSLSFAPSNGSTVAIVANTTPSSVSGNLAAAGAATKLRVFNSSTTLFVFFRCTVAAAPVATSADVPLAPGQALIIDGNFLTACAVLNSGTSATATVFFTWGAGGL